MMFVHSLKIFKLIAESRKQSGDAKVLSAIDHNTTVPPCLLGASPANAICADLTRFSMLLSRPMIRTFDERPRGVGWPRNVKPAPNVTTLTPGVCSAGSAAPRTKWKDGPYRHASISYFGKAPGSQQWMASCLSSLLHCPITRIRKTRLIQS